MWFELGDYILDPMPPMIDVPVAGHSRGNDFTALCFSYFEGHVTESGAPAAGVFIEALRDDGTMNNISTDEFGNYLIQVAEGTYDIFVTAGYSSDPARYSDEVIEGGDTLSGYDFNVIDLSSTDASISGTVTSSDSSPFEWIRIEAFSEVLDYIYETSTDSLGQYTIELLGGYTYDVTPRSGLTAFDPLSARITLGTGENSTGIDFVENGLFEMDAEITGNAEYSDGTPAVGFFISAYCADFSVECFTDSTGVFELDVLGGYDYNLSISAGEFISIPIDYRDIEVASGASASGYEFVLLSSSETDATISGNVSYDVGGNAEGILINVSGSDVSYSFSAYTDGSGNFEIGVMGGYSYIVSPSVEHYSVEPSLYSVSIASGGTDSGNDFVLTAVGGTTVMSYEISSGWNMLSHPALIDVFIDDYFDFALSAYNYDTDDGTYVLTETLESGYAFWLLCPDSRTVEYTFLPSATSWVVSIVSGWNFIGMPDSTVPASALLDNPSIISVFEYNPTSGAYSEPVNLVPGLGYWLLATESLFLTLP